MPGQDVADHRLVCLRAGRPKRIVMRGGEWQARIRHLPKHGALQPHVMAAMHLLDARLDVIDRNAGNAVEALGIRLAEIGNPVVVELERLLLRLDIIDAKQRHSIVGKQDLRGDPIGVLIAQAQMRIGGARRRIAEWHVRQLLAQARWQFLPEFVGLHHMGIRRDHLRHGGCLRLGQLLTDHCAPWKGARLLLGHACKFRSING